MASATAHQASTIHRLLEADNMGFQRDRDQPLESELLIIDESSMVDTLLMDALLDAIPSSARLVLVGDVDQLPSVGPGMVLRDLIDSETINVVRLERIFRQSEESLITSNAHHVRLGHLPELPKGENSGNLKDFYFIRESDPEQIVGKIIQMVSKNIPDRFGFNPFQDIQVLTPMHAGVTGTINLNRRLQSVLNPDGAGFEYREQWFKIGDKLMQQQNDYEKQVFNGDMGRIVACDPKSREVHVEFDQGTVRYSAKEIDQLALAYAISVHKSQGSEYPALILPLTTQHYMMLQRNLLYTALTRGKQLVILIGMEKAVAMAVKNEDARTRHTSLPRHFREIKQLMAL
jgi:exodeoxyribonuclease V alpha subunit